MRALARAPLYNGRVATSTEIITFCMTFDKCRNCEKTEKLKNYLSQKKRNNSVKLKLFGILSFVGVDANKF